MNPHSHTHIFTDGQEFVSWVTRENALHGWVGWSLTGFGFACILHDVLFYDF
jgi:hypothetical protein